MYSIVRCAFLVLFLCFSLQARVVALIELSGREASVLVPLERSIKKELNRKGLEFRPTRQKKHITVTTLTKFHETLPGLQRNHPNVLTAISNWTHTNRPFSLTPLLNTAHIEFWAPPYFKSHYWQKYPDYYNVVLSFAPYAPLDNFTRGLDTVLRKIPGYRYKRRNSFIPHITLGRVYPRSRRFSDKQVSVMERYARFINAHLDPHFDGSHDQVSCLLIKESNQRHICIPFAKRAIK